jgi:serine/threonine protein kinase
MPPPASVPEFLDLVQKSGVADEAKLKAYLANIGGADALPSEPSKAAGYLVRDGMLTYFQAEQILQGKWKRFSIGKYKVLERLGAGGMGQVFLCEHKLMRRRVAVKVLPTAKAADQASLERFNREARAAAAVDHPNIVRAFDIDQDENLHFLVMEYVDGTNLQDLIKKTGPLDAIRACHYIYASAVGLQHANEIGMVHRDIKPGNILLDRSGVVKILDMGLARLTFDTDDHITRKYDENILGTADYLSPEQAEDSHTVDIRSDIYSLGATFYYLLTGHQPFPEGTIPQKLIWHRSREPRAIREIRTDVPDAVAGIVAKMMAKKPSDRYQSPAELIAALQPWVAVPIPPPSDQEMPVLSPAVAGGQAVRATTQRAAVGPSTSAGVEPGYGAQLNTSTSISYAPPTTGITQPLPPIGPSPDAGVWESLDEAPSAAAGDTGRGAQTVPEGRSSRLRPTPNRDASPRRRPPLIFAAAVLVLAGAGVGAYFAFFRTPPTDPGPQQHPPGTARRLVVARGKVGVENTYATLGEALRKAAPGDTIAVEEPTLTEPAVRVTKRDLTIESALPDGRPVTFSLTTSNPGVAVIEATGVEGFRLRRFVVDARDGADYAVALSGNLGGTLIENVTVQGGKKGGVRLLNPAGAPGRPVVLDRVRVVMSKDQDVGVRVEAAATLVAKAVAVRNSRFDGPGKIGVGFEGSVDDAEITGNRFFQLATAVSATRPGDRMPLKFNFNQNTVVGGKVGVLVTGPAGGTPAVAIAVNRNYFARVSEAIGRADGDLLGLVAAQNGRAADARTGNLNLNAVELTPPPPYSTNPAEDATFLRFNGPAPLVEGRRVGAE